MTDKKNSPLQREAPDEPRQKSGPHTLENHTLAGEDFCSVSQKKLKRDSVAPQITTKYCLAFGPVSRRILVGSPSETRISYPGHLQRQWYIYETMIMRCAKNLAKPSRA